MLVRISAPAPLDVALAREHLRLDGIAEDHLLQVYLEAARRELDGPDGVLGQCVGPQLWRLSLPGWTDRVVLPVEPVRAVAVEYDDAAGVVQELPAADYEIEQGTAMRPRLRMTASGLPQLAAVPWPVRVTIEAGLEEIPPHILVAIWMRAADLFEHRDSGGGGSENPAWAALVTRSRRHF